MGLAEKRKIEELKKVFLDWEKKIQKAAGNSIPMEVNWESIVTEETLGYVDQAFEKVFVEASVAGFKELCQDQMGKDAIKESVKKIIIQNKAGNHYGEPSPPVLMKPS